VKKLNARKGNKLKNNNNVNNKSQNKISCLLLVFNLRREERKKPHKRERLIPVRCNLKKSQRKFEFEFFYNFGFIYFSLQGHHVLSILFPLWLFIKDKTLQDPLNA
jgi:hypothetical protein